MKAILLVSYADLSTIPLGLNSTPTITFHELDQYFRLLASEKHDFLHFVSLHGEQIDDSFRSLVDNLQPDLVVSSHDSLTLRRLCESKGFSYYHFQPFALGSKYIKDIWLCDEHAKNQIWEQITKSYQKISSFIHKNCPEHRKTLTIDDNTLHFSDDFFMQSHANELSPLSEENAFYSRFHPLPAPQADIFYNRQYSRFLVFGLDSLKIHEPSTTQEIIKAIQNLTKKATHPVCLVFFGNNGLHSDLLKKSLFGLPHVAIETVPDHFKYMENSIYSMIQKSDIIITPDLGIGCDAIVLKKTTYFLFPTSVVAKNLNRVFDLSEYSNILSLKEISQLQYCWLSTTLSLLSNRNLLFENKYYSAVEIHRKFAILLHDEPTQTSPANFHDTIHPQKDDSVNPIVSQPKDNLRSKRLLYSEYRRKKIILCRKFSKFKSDPRSFYRDSRYAILRFIGSLL